MTATPNTIVFIHGLWMTPRSWEDWIARYELYERYHVPAASTVLFEGAFANFHRNAPTKVDFGNDDRAPLLVVAFGDDHIIPPKASRHNAEKYGKSTATTSFREFPGRPHFPGAPGWEDVADYALSSAMEHAPSPRA